MSALGQLAETLSRLFRKVTVASAYTFSSVSFCNWLPQRHTHNGAYNGNTTAVHCSNYIFKAIISLRSLSY